MVLTSDPETAPANLLADEHLFRAVARGRPPAWRLYVNPPCVVVGRHQLIEREVNLREASLRKLPIFRRFTGGGAVYHDYGNLNFAACEPISSKLTDPLVRFERFSGWLVDLLRNFGLDGTLDGNRVLVRGRKVSGLAARRGRGAVFVHGTLLVRSDLGRLREVLNVPPEQLRGLAPPSGPHVISRPFPETTMSIEAGRDLKMGKVEAAARELMCRHFGFGEFAPCPAPTSLSPA